MTSAPIADGFHPAARAQLVAVVEILILVEVATTLHQAEAAWVVDTIAADVEALRVVQRTPDPLAVAGMNAQAFGIMQLRTVVGAWPGLVGTEQVHAGQRRDAELFDVLTQVDLRLHLEHAVAPRFDFHAVSAGGTRRVEQCVDHQAAAIGLRLFDPEFAETRELFARWQRGVDGQATRGETEYLALADDTEVAGAQHTHHFVVRTFGIDLVDHLEAGEAQILEVIRVQVEIAEVEHRRVVLDFLGAFGGHFVDLHRHIEVHALVEEVQPERRLAISPVCFFLKEAHLLIASERQFAQRSRQIALRRAVAFGGKRLGLDRHIIQIKGPALGSEQQREHTEGQLAGLAHTGSRTTTHRHTASRATRTDKQRQAQGRPLQGVENGRMVQTQREHDADSQPNGDVSACADSFCALLPDREVRHRCSREYIFRLLGPRPHWRGNSSKRASCTVSESSPNWARKAPGSLTCCRLAL